MMLAALILSQITDPFRLGMLFFLTITAARTRSVSGEIVPLIGGAVFVALIIPMVLHPAGEDLARQAIVGIFVNGIVLALFLGVRSLWRRR